MRRRLTLVALSALVLAACSERPAPTGVLQLPESPAAVISDGAHGNGNPNFFFLPPVQPSPRGKPNFDKGQFNPNLLPVVTICDASSTTSAGDCVTPLKDKTGHLAVFLAVRGWDGLPDWIDPEQYHVLWQTRNYNLVVDGKHAYRIAVKVGKTLLGFLDLVPTSSLAGALRITAGGQDVGWLQNLVVPIRFRIENGALCANGASTMDCAESAVTGAASGSAGDTTQKIVTPSGFAALALPPGAVKPGDTVTIVIAKEAPSYRADTTNPADTTKQCLPTGLTQSKGCWRFSSEPAGYVFQHDVKVEFCVDAAPVPSGQQDKLRVFKHDSGTGVQQLPWVEPTDVACGQFTAMGNVGSAHSSFASAVVRQVGKWAGRLLLPQPLYARRHAPSKGIGGSGGSFSDFGGAVPPEGMSIKAGNGQSAEIGTAVATPPSVIVRDVNGDPQSGVSVTFTTMSLDSAVVSPSTPVVTDANGVAAVTSWTLGPTARLDTLIASAPGVPGSPVMFTATATPGPAVEIDTYDGFNQIGTGGQAVATSPAVRARDWYGNGVPGVSVTFAVASGGGNVQPSVATTDSRGVAQTTWTLGPRAGWNWVTASITGLNTDTFTVYGTAAPLTPDQISKPANWSSEYGNYVSPGSCNLVQSFTPSASALDAISLDMQGSPTFPDAGYRTTINVRNGSGDVVGTSDATVPYPFSYWPIRTVPFFFSPPLVLTPGATYKIEWVAPAQGSSLMTWDIVHNWTGDVYTGGTALDCNGSALPAYDWVFTTWYNAALPDLVVSAVNLQTAQVNPGGQITYDYTVANIGAEGPAGLSTFDVAVYLSADPVLDAGDVQVGSGYSVWQYHLGVGWSYTYQMSNRPIPDTVGPGTYYLIVKADAFPGQAYPGVVEANENNNWRASTTTLTVLAP